MYNEGKASSVLFSAQYSIPNIEQATVSIFEWMNYIGQNPHYFQIQMHKTMPGLCMLHYCFFLACAKTLFYCRIGTGRERQEDFWFLVKHVVSLEVATPS